MSRSTFCRDSGVRWNEMQTKHNFWEFFCVGWRMQFFHGEAGHVDICAYTEGEQDNYSCSSATTADTQHYDSEYHK
jgi:hypothetical protein